MDLWKTRTIDELRRAKCESEEGPYLVAYVNRGEAILLCEAGAVVLRSGISFFAFCGKKTQVYSFEGKIYFWLAGYGSGSWSDEYPVLFLECVASK